MARAVDQTGLVDDENKNQRLWSSSACRVRCEVLRPHGDRGGRCADRSVFLLVRDKLATQQVNRSSWAARICHRPDDDPDRVVAENQLHGAAPLLHERALREQFFQMVDGQLDLLYRLTYWLVCAFVVAPRRELLKGRPASSQSCHFGWRSDGQRLLD